MLFKKSLFLFFLFSLQLFAQKSDLLKSKLGKEVVKEKLEHAKIHTLKTLPSGVFKAKKLYRELKEILEDIKKTKEVDDSLIFELFLSSTETMNAWVSKVHDLQEVKAYHIASTKGLLDLITNTDKAKEYLGEELAQEANAHSRSIMAIVIGHEVGHAVHGDVEKLERTTGVYMEFKADDFGVRVAYEAGYDPKAAHILFKIFDKIQSNKSIRHLIAGLLDEHPKPSLRSAALEDLINTLNQRREAYEKFNISLNEVAISKDGSLDRSHYEKTSRTSVVTLEKYLSTEAYESLDFRQKLQALEEYLMIQNEEVKSMHQETIVRITDEYSYLLDEVNDLRKTNSVIESFKRFETSVGEHGKLTSSKRIASPKKAINELKQKINNKQIELLTFDINFHANLAQIQQWVREIDERVAVGSLIKLTHQAKSTQELQWIIDLLGEEEHLLHERFLRNSQSKKHMLTFYAQLCNKHLLLTKDLNVTYDFIQNVLRISKTESSKVIFALNQVFAEITNTLLTHPEIEVNKFVHRIQYPVNAKEKIFSKNLEDSQRNIAGELRERLGKNAELNPLNQEFSYGIGRSPRWQRTALSTDFITYLNKVTGIDGVNFVFNSLVKTHYNIEETLDLLIANNINRDFWEEHREAILDIDRTRYPRDLEANLKRIEKVLMTIKPSEFNEETLTKENLKEASHLPHFNPIQEELIETYRKSQTILKENILTLFEQFNKNLTYVSSIEGNTAEPKKTSIPVLHPQHIQRLSNQDKIEVFKLHLKSDELRRINLHAERFQNSLKVYESGLDELLKEGKIDEKIRINYLNGLIEFNDIVQKINKNPHEKIPESFFNMKRSLHLKTKILFHSTINYSSKLTSLSQDSLEALIDKFNNGASTPTNGQKILESFLVPGKKEVIDYLKNPSTNQNFISNFELAISLCDILAKHQGVSYLINTKEGFTSIQANLNRSFLNKIKNKNPQILNREAQLNKDEKLLFEDIAEAYRYIFNKESKSLKIYDSRETLIEQAMKFIWPIQYKKMIEEKDPVNSLILILSNFLESSKEYTFAKNRSTQIIGNDKSEEQIRLFYAYLMNSLQKVETKEQMQEYTALYSLFLHGRLIGPEVSQNYLKANLKTLMNITGVKYREYFFDSLVAKITQFDAWYGQKDLPNQNINKIILFFSKYLYNRANAYQNSFGKATRLLKELDKLIILNEAFKKIENSKLNQYVTQKIKNFSSLVYTKTLSQKKKVGNVKKVNFLQDLRRQTPWSQNIDNEISDYIKSSHHKRKKVIELTKNIRSLNKRLETYQYVLKKYGKVKMNFITKARLYIKLYKAYKEAEAVWTKEVLDDLKNSTGLINAWHIIENAWEDHVAKRAGKMGIPKETALEYLLDLHEANQKLENPPAGEIAAVFPEGSKHRDGLLEEHIKSRKSTFEQLKAIEKYKSYNTESPYHKISKAFGEILEEYVGKLTPVERVHFSLYLANFDDKLEKDLEEKVKKLFFGKDKRKKTMRENGYYFTLSEIKEFFQETHTLEKALVFRGLFVGESGVNSSKEAIEILANRILLSDEDMPPYLRSVLKIYFQVLNESEISRMFSGLLAQGSQDLKGPQVLKILVENGGVAAAKLAQIIASHGFQLPQEYQDVLEKFKGQAQEVEKIRAMNWISQRLPQDKFNQIKTLNHELGSGSLKLAYSATLKDGRVIVIKLAREYIYEKTLREFELLKQALELIMQDPTLRIENLPALREEVERIITEEMQFKKEFEMNIAHNNAIMDRPLLVKIFGNKVNVQVPVPLEGWQFDGVMAEEFIKADSWGQLPEKSLLGWSKQSYAKAVVNEILNQLTSFIQPSEKLGGNVILDIDPHEENQLAKKRLLVLKGNLVNIDLGQSVIIEPQKVRGFMSIIGAIKFKKIEEAVEMAKEYLIIDSEEQSQLLREEIERQSLISNDPIEVFSKSMEKVELKGISLRPEYLFFQKLFATLVGMKAHIADKNYLMTQAQKIMGLRFLSSPSTALNEYKKFKQVLKQAKCNKHFD